MNLNRKVKSKLEIFFIRHGESVGNKENRFRGRHDFVLSENGFKQAEALRRELEQTDFDAVYSSPLKRALDTARAICPPYLNVQTDEDINNISLGPWENQPKTDISRKYPDLWQIWLTQPEALFFEGMETLAMVQERTFHFVNKMIDKYCPGRIAVVSHRAVLKPLFARMLGIPKNYFWKIELDTASYSVAEYNEDRGFTFTIINQNRHLSEYIREDLG
jgi:probable phosphoglycerate mutase